MAKSKTGALPKLRLGLEKTFGKAVPHEWTIAHFDHRLPAVLSTPAMIGMMETAAAFAVRSHLPKGSITVGTRIEVDHLKAAPEGARVRARAKLVGIEGRFLVFEVEARTGKHVLGKGRVYRAIVETTRFFTRAEQRTAKVRRTRGRSVRR